MTGLRERQKALARRTIMDALVEVVAERRHLDFSIQEVADRAAVSLRTVYNHFPNREALLDGLTDHFNDLALERGGVLIGQIRTLEELRAALPRNFRVWEEMAELMEAWTQVSATSGVAAAEHAHRTERIPELVAEALPHVPPDDQRMVGLLIRHLLSFRSWSAITRDYGLPTEQAIQIVQWTIDAALAQVAAGDLPSRVAAPDTRPRHPVIGDPAD